MILNGRLKRGSGIGSDDCSQPRVNTRTTLWQPHGRAITRNINIARANGEISSQHLFVVQPVASDMSCIRYDTIGADRFEIRTQTRVYLSSPLQQCTASKHYVVQIIKYTRPGLHYCGFAPAIAIPLDEIRVGAARPRSPIRAAPALIRFSYIVSESKWLFIKRPVDLTHAPRRAHTQTEAHSSFSAFPSVRASSSSLCLADLWSDAVVPAARGSSSPAAKVLDAPRLRNDSVKSQSAGGIFLCLSRGET